MLSLHRPECDELCCVSVLAFAFVLVLGLRMLSCVPGVVEDVAVVVDVGIGVVDDGLWFVLSQRDA